MLGYYLFLGTLLFWTKNAALFEEIPDIECSFQNYLSPEQKKMECARREQKILKLARRVQKKLFARRVQFFFWKFVRREQNL